MPIFSLNNNKKQTESTWYAWPRTLLMGKCGSPKAGLFTGCGFD